MPPLALLKKLEWSRERVLAIWAMWGYLLFAVAFFRRQGPAPRRRLTADRTTTERRPSYAHDPSLGSSVPTARTATAGDYAEARSRCARRRLFVVCAGVLCIWVVPPFGGGVGGGGRR